MRVLDVGMLQRSLAADRLVIDAGGVPTFETAPVPARAVAPSAPPPMPLLDSALPGSAEALVWDTGAVEDDVDDVEPFDWLADTSSAAPPPMPMLALSAAAPSAVAPAAGGRGDLFSSINARRVEATSTGGSVTAPAAGVAVKGKGKKGKGQDVGGALPPPPPSPAVGESAAAPAAGGRGDLFSSVNARHIEPAATDDLSADAVPVVPPPVPPVSPPLHVRVEPSTSFSHLLNGGSDNELRRLEQSAQSAREDRYRHEQELVRNLSCSNDLLQRSMTLLH